MYCVCVKYCIWATLCLCTVLYCIWLHHIPLYQIGLHLEILCLFIVLLCFGLCLIILYKIRLHLVRLWLVFGLYWVLRSLCIRVLYRCRALWSNRAIKLQGRQCQMSPVQLQDKNVKYIKVQKRIWQKRIKYKAVLTQTCFLCSCIHSPFPSISTCLMRKFDHHKNLVVNCCTTSKNKWIYTLI